ncbi:prevent-host-death protein [Flexivirga sp.]|uniref:prevent-host-death protein n=1 Tax=Flexivirga sp. TaxID=1962927 RepID=UPI002D7F1627|nr:prevent-host-death protein [Flexivirga sp.]
MPAQTIQPTFPSSDLSRHSTKVFEAAEDQPVAVTRRDGEDLVLMSKREADARAELLNFAAQIIAASTDDRGTLPERMANAFPWMLALSENGRDKCAHELVEAARGSFATGQPYLAIATMTAWRETAINMAAGYGSEPVEWFDEGVPVERP